MAGSPTRKLFVSFQISSDEAFQQTEVRAKFTLRASSQRGGQEVDVSYLLAGEEPPFDGDGLLVTAGGLVRPAREEECVDNWPGDGDWFYTWEDLASAYWESPGEEDNSND